MTSEFMGLLVWIAVFIIIPKIFLRNRVNNYNPKNVNPTKITSDKVNNHLSASDVQKNMVSGKYDWKPGEYNVYKGKIEK